MKKNKSKTEYNVLPFESDTELDSILKDIGGVTESDIASADRLLRASADEQNSRVDYAGMLRSIKAEAIKQGLASAVNTGKDKKGRVGRIIGIAASVAAAFVLCIGVIGVMSSLYSRKSPGGDKSDNSGQIAYVDGTANAQPVETQSSPIEPVDTAPAATSVPMRSESAPLPTPDTSDFVESTPLPTEVAVKGGVRGYTYITGFTAPNKSAELYEGLLPEGMKAEPVEEGLGFIAMGDAESGDFRFISCRLEDAAESDEAPGIAIYTIKMLGGVSFVWRIDENKLMYIEFEGFDYSEAEAFLFAYSQREAELTPAA